jgi:hypothetical protein
MLHKYAEIIFSLETPLHTFSRFKERHHDTISSWTLSRVLISSVRDIVELGGLNRSGSKGAFPDPWSREFRYGPICAVLNIEL